MCGIAGYIGESKNPDVSFELLTSIFALSEVRGTDAAGFWGAQKDGGKIMYHKQPDKSSEFVKNQVWKAIRHLNPNLIICHARGASIGVGAPSINRNNHPFVTHDKCVGLVHNGRIPEPEYDVLSKKYETASRCDSEILLRIFEAAEAFDDKEQINDDEEKQINFRLAGLKDIWSQVIKGHMAVAIGERIENGSRRLWLFRNEHRPIWLIDLRKHLGQVFFCSTPEIWREAVKRTPALQRVMRGNRKIKLIELPQEEVWVLSTSSDSPIVRDELVRKFEVRSEGMFTYSYSGSPIQINKQKSEVEVFTRLDDDEDVVDEDKKKINSSWRPNNSSSTSTSTHSSKWVGGGCASKHYGQGYQQYNKTTYQGSGVTAPSTDDDDDKAAAKEDKKVMESFSVLKINNAVITIEDIMTECETIKKLVDEIITIASNKSMENGGDLDAAQKQSLLEDLDRIKLDLEATIKILEN